MIVPITASIIASLHLLSLLVPISGFTSFQHLDGRNDWRARHQRYASIIDASSVDASRTAKITTHSDGSKQPRWLIQWRGEGAEGYSMSLRQWEFTSAFCAELTSYFLNNNNLHTADGNVQQYLEGIKFEFHDALQYQGPIYDPNNAESNTNSGVEPIPISQVAAYESAMQYMIVQETNDSCDSIPNLASQPGLLTNLIKNTVERCSLVRTMLDIVADGATYEDAAKRALENGSFADMMENGINANSTWSIRLRRYTSESVDSIETDQPTLNSTKKNPQYQARYGKNVRSSLKDEKKAIMDMTELVQLLQGKVNLKEPDCKIYLLEGLKSYQEESSRVLLARVIANGPKTSIYAPKTRICVTTTPLCPIASFTMCNIAQVLRKKTTILDPFAGSCATLLAAAHITNGYCQSVGVEICHNGHVNRDNIRADFESRSLPPPLVIRGDCLSSDIRDEARSEIGGDAFDFVITDPPYGIREAMGSQDGDENDNTPPLTKLFQVMASDRVAGKPLLKVGGRLVAFIPVRKGETLQECLPPPNIQKEAGLVMEGEGKEQVLNDVLSRWLVSFFSQ